MNPFFCVNTQVDFQAYDLSSFYQSPVRTSGKRHNTLPKLDDSTSYNTCYPKYNVKPRERHGDNYEIGYTPIMDKFDTKTTTQDVFYAKSAEIPRSFKPPEKGVDQSGSHDFTTINMVTYKKPSTANLLTDETAKVLFKALQSRKTGGVQPQNGAIQPVPV